MISITVSKAAWNMALMSSRAAGDILTDHAM